MLHCLSFVKKAVLSYSCSSVSSRSGLTFVCGIYVFGATWFLLGTNPEENVTGNVAPQFMVLRLSLSIVLGGGGYLVTSLPMIR